MTSEAQGFVEELLSPDGTSLLTRQELLLRGRRY